MTVADGIEVRQGQAGWMQLMHLAASLLGALAILISPAPWWLKAMMLTGLSAFHLAAARHARRTAQSVSHIRLFEDGTASLLTPDGRISALLMEGAWTSRWFSVMRLQPLDGRRPVHCTIARSANLPDDYRRLRVLLRHPGVHGRESRWNWL